MTGKKSISLCMIVKNEEEFLAQCLESVKDLVDEMIIVDTGSTDRTVEIAKSYGAEMYYFEWNGSFSEARNFGLSHATCEWVLQLDADEVLEKADIPILKSVIETKDFNAIFVALLNETPGGWAKHYFQRIFRRDKAHFEGIVHNQLVYKGKHLVTEIRVYHYGYNLSKEKMKAKYKRTEELLLKQLQEDNTNAFAWRNYLRILRSQKRYEELVREANRAFALCNKTMSDVNRQLVAYDLVYSLTQLSRFEEAEEITSDYLQKYSDNYDLWFSKGLAQMGSKNYKEAIKTMQHYIQLKTSGVKIHPQIICDTFTLQHKAYAMISDAFFELANFENAKESINKAMALFPDNPIYHLSLARILASTHNGKEAEQVVKQAVKSLSPDEKFFIKWGMMCKLYPALGTTFDALKSGVKHYPHSADLYNHAAYNLLESQPDEAVELWKKTLMLNEKHIGALAGLAKVYFAKGDFDNLIKQARKIIAISTTAPILKDVAHFCAMAKRYDMAIQLLSFYLENRPTQLITLSKLALYYAQNGQFGSALVGVQEILKNKPHDPAIQKNLSKIKQIVEESTMVAK